MSDSPEETPSLFPPLEKCTVGTAHRIICADWLRCIARLIENGAIDAFDVAWNQNLKKPQGKIVAASTFLTGPAEAEFDAQVERYNQSKLMVLDISEDLKDHTPCEGEAREHCALCNDKLS